MFAPNSDRGPRAARSPLVSVIVPARNEQACIGACLHSLVAQSGVDFEVIVVDDGSTDATAELARSIPGVRVIAADPLPPHWVGKSNACWTGARHASGEWLLFTDADTVHKPDSLARSLQEAEEHGAGLLSYSPGQDVRTLPEMALMPLVFAELACTYRPSDVCDPASPAAAANGQFLLIARKAYDAVGGHAAVASTLLEDVELARLVKRAGYVLRFRFGGDAVRTRMYRSLRQMTEGWTKNLALLFPSPLRLAARRCLEFLLGAGAVTTAIAAAVTGSGKVAIIAAAIAVPT